jgi:nucleotide-binding universal stress UspA family protein
MFRTIIVPLDGIETAEAAVPYAAEEAQRHNARLVLLRVVPQPEMTHEHLTHGGPLPIVYAYPEDERDCLLDHAQAYLRTVVQRYRLDDEPIISVRCGDPYLRLKSAIEHYPAPLVVIASPASSRGRAPVLADTLNGLLREGPAPVLVIRGAQPVGRETEQPAEVGALLSLVDQPREWKDLVLVDALVAGSN